MKNTYKLTDAEMFDLLYNKLNKRSTSIVSYKFIAALLELLNKYKTQVCISGSFALSSIMNYALHKEDEQYNDIDIFIIHNQNIYENIIQLFKGFKCKRHETPYLKSKYINLQNGKFYIYNFTKDNLKFQVIFNTSLKKVININDYINETFDLSLSKITMHSNTINILTDTKKFSENKFSLEPSIINNKFNLEDLTKLYKRVEKYINRGYIFE